MPNNLTFQSKRKYNFRQNAKALLKTENSRTRQAFEGQMMPGLGRFLIPEHSQVKVGSSYPSLFVSLPNPVKGIRVGRMAVSLESPRQGNRQTTASLAVQIPQIGRGISQIALTDSLLEPELCFIAVGVDSYPS